MSDIVWGEPIEVNGVRPEWLRDDDKLSIVWDNDGLWLNSTSKTHYEWDDLCVPDRVTAIRLPASHPYYTVQRYNAKHGTSFVYWPGGDAAPADWDGGDVLRIGDSHYHPTPTYVAPYEVNQRWHSLEGPNRRHGENFCDIIGYTRHTEPSPATDDSDYVRVKRMTESEWSELWIDTGCRELGSYLGIIKPEPTEAERIADKTGLSVEQVQAVLDAQSA